MGLDGTQTDENSCAISLFELPCAIALAIRCSCALNWDNREEVLFRLNQANKKYVFNRKDRPKRR